MEMTFRWFGKDDDSIPLSYIKQIPKVSGVVGGIFDIPAGEVWPLERIFKLKKQVNDYGLKLEVIESVNIHEDIKLGLPSRDTYIKNYQETIRHLAQAGVKVICYNFMPVFDWTRSDLAKRLPDGSTVLAYEKEKFTDTDPHELVQKIEQSSNGFSLPGWEPERLSAIKKLFKQYEHVSEEDLFDHLQYFLENIIPVAEECGIKMAIHPDDPPWSVFGLPRIVTNENNLQRILQLVDHPSNGLTLCSGSLGASAQNDVPEIFRNFIKQGRVPFVHIRNVKRYDNGDFFETSHCSTDGSLDMYQLVKVLHDHNYSGYVRPDHGRMIWGEEGRPGYGLYDRALGIMYLYGIWDSLGRTNGTKELSVDDKQASQS
ncbi:mannonate dehydratase [Evansella halocellulosilytica]|uniref:mannonate dehydratase n=1 Tax=Evansella halocellulosilytica TaxID=2011013 RepID=UPI000BB77B71|nr:mannonate dehydratase [Evansella halocellulosilytica]